MQPDPIDRDFQKFRESRDPAALAAVFDAAAPRLLLVAMHLCRDAATAEDLVQTVFLQVLRDADRFDPRRPVMPWLLGMLEHRASDLRQRAHVRREQSGDAAAVAGGPSPEQSAAANEVRERVAEALAGMPRDYRDVLALRLVHGLSSVEIAHAHGLAPATVRTRLRRGIELLRGALPRGLATHGLLALLAAELAFARDGLSAVRTKVLATATGATFAAGWWLSLAACLALAIGGWVWFAPSLATEPSFARSDAAISAARGAAAPGDRPRERDVPDVAQRTAVAPAEGANPDVTTVRGRVLDAVTGLPLTGVLATTQTHPVGGRDSEPDWRDPDPVTTAADGTFAVRFVPSRHRYVEVVLHADGFVEEASSFEPLRTGVEVDTGDVMLRPGTPVRLRLLSNGKPLVGVETYASRAPNGERPNGARGYGVSDADGFVDLGMCKPGAWWHDVRTAHVGAKARFDVPLQRAPLVVAVELREPPRERSISGVLLDTNDAPVAGIELGMRMPGGGMLQAATRTDGRFLWALAVRPPGEVRERIELPRDKRELAWIDDGGDVAWGTHDLRLVVRRRAPATLRLEVFDAATQQPVEAFGASCRAELGSGSAEHRRVVIEQHTGGVATLAVPPGKYFASVFPAEPFAECAEIPVEFVEGSTTTLRVPLRPPAELTVEVVDAATGAPREGIELALMKAVLAESTRDIPSTWYQQFREHPGMRGGSGKFAVIVLARGVSDEHGRVCLRAPADVLGLVLVAGGPRCVPSEHHDLVLPEDGAKTTIRVTSAAVVRGVVTPRGVVERLGPPPERLAKAAEDARTQWTEPQDIADRYPRVELRPVGGKGNPELGAHVAADGTFAIGSVPAGSYEVWFVPIVINIWTQVGPVAVIQVDATIALPAVVVDVPQLLPARGTVRFFVDGEPARGDGGLARLVEGGTDKFVFPIGADGTAATPWLLPGTYVPFVEVGDRARIFGSERIVVTAGSRIDATFALQRRTVAVTIAEAAGAPARGVVVRAEAIDRPDLGSLRWLRGRTDDAGRLVLDAAPRGRLRLRAFARDQDLRRSDIEPALLLGDIAADAKEATFRLEH